MLAAKLRKGIDGPQGRVDGSQERRQSRFLIRVARPSFPRRSVGADHPSGDQPHQLLRGSEVVQRASVHRTRSPRSDLPDDATAERLVHQLSDRLTGRVEDLERFVDMVRQEESRDRIHHLRRIDLIDGCFPRRDARIGGIDEPKEPAGGSADTRPQPELSLCPHDLVTRGHAHLLERKIERSSERVHQTRTPEPECPGEDQLRHGDRYRLDDARLVAATEHSELIHGESEQLLLDPVERCRDDVQLFDGVSDPIECLGRRAVNLADVVQIALLFGLQPFRD